MVDSISFLGNNFLRVLRGRKNLCPLLSISNPSSLIFLFKLFQYIFFGISSFFNYAIHTNNQINSKQFTETEIEALKNIAKDALHSDNSMIDIQEDFEITELQETEMEVLFEKQEIIIEKNKNLTAQIKEKFTNIKSLLPKFNLNSTKLYKIL